MISLSSAKKQLAKPNTSWQICLLAIIGGCASALLIILFNLSIEALQSLYLKKPHDYTSLDDISRIDLPIVGALVILVFAWFTGYKYVRTGIPFVLHRLKVAYGVIPYRNTLNQFFGSVVALATGFSVGREGPAVHLGAACSSYIGSVLKLPYNSIRTLCACGIAAGIAASFNTPIAAVIFVMEVILREYKVYMFIPIMLAAIVGSMITSSVFGPVHEFEYIRQISLEIRHYPALIMLGIFLGTVAFGFNRYLVMIIKYSAKYHIIPRFMLAAFITGLLGYAVPFAMGIGTSAINFSIENQWQFQLLASLLAAKILMTIFALGLGIPGGIVGPILGIGAIAGTFISVVVAQFYPGSNFASDFALMGMAGFMAATLNAPLAALLAVVELSNQIEIVIPAMIVITTACLSSGQLFKNRSIFTMQLDIQNLTYRKPPIENSLQKIGVLAVMKTKLAIFDAREQTKAEALIKSAHNNQEIVVKKINESKTTFHWLSKAEDQDIDQTLVHLDYHQLIPVSSQSTLAEVYQLLSAQRAGGVYIYKRTQDEIVGIVSFEQVRSYLTKGK